MAMAITPVTVSHRRTKQVKTLRSAAAQIERALIRHPVVTFTAALVLTGCGMVLAVTLTTLLFVLPLGFFFGWY